MKKLRTIYLVYLTAPKEELLYHDTVGWYIRNSQHITNQDNTITMLYGWASSAKLVEDFLEHRKRELFTVKEKVLSKKKAKSFELENALYEIDYFEFPLYFKSYEIDYRSQVGFDRMELSLPVVNFEHKSICGSYDIGVEISDKIEKIGGIFIHSMFQSKVENLLSDIGYFNNGMINPDSDYVRVENEFWADSSLLGGKSFESLSLEDRLDYLGESFAAEYSAYLNILTGKEMLVDFSDISLNTVKVFLYFYRFLFE